MFVTFYYFEIIERTFSTRRRPDLTVTDSAEACVSSSSAYKLLLPDSFAILERVHGCSPTAHLSLMSAFVIVVHQPLVQVDLQHLDVFISFFRKS